MVKKIDRTGEEGYNKFGSKMVSIQINIIYGIIC